MRRHHDWAEKLFSFIEERKEIPFEWGEQDCGTFAADDILGFTGIDIAEGFRGHTTALRALRALRAAGGLEKATEAACAKAGFVEHGNVRQAKRGDLMLMDTPRYGPALGICVGRYAVFVGRHKLEQWPVEHCRRAWATI